MTTLKDKTVVKEPVSDTLRDLLGTQPDGLRTKCPGLLCLKWLKGDKGEIGKL